MNSTQKRRLAQGVCISCGAPCSPTNKRVCEYHAKKNSEWRRLWKERNRVRHNKHHEIYRKRHPEKWAARKVVERGLRFGRIVRPECCQDCGSVVKLYAHHEDYSKPLEIAWICNACHVKRHHARAEDQVNEG